VGAGDGIVGEGVVWFLANDPAMQADGESRLTAYPGKHLQTMISPEASSNDSSITHAVV
jgi:hypothetical protein